MPRPHDCHDRHIILKHLASQELSTDYSYELNRPGAYYFQYTNQIITAVVVSRQYHSMIVVVQASTQDCSTAQPVLKHGALILNAEDQNNTEYHIIVPSVEQYRRGSDNQGAAIKGYQLLL